MAGKFQKFFVDIDLNGNKLFNTKIGANSNMGVGGAFQYNDSNNRLEYYNGSALEEIANLSDIEAITGGLIFQGGYDPTTNTPNLFFSQQAGGIDPSFAYGSGFNGSVRSTAIQSDGKILVGGGFTDYNGTGADRIIRLNSNGSVDTSFVYGTGFNGSVLSIAIQSDGKIVCGGSFSSYNGTLTNKIIRLNTDGSIDTSFVYGAGFNSNVYSTAIQTDGKIVVGGSFTDYDGTPANFIIRLNSDGSVDTSFVYGTGFSGAFVFTIAIQSDGKILLGGFFTDYNGTSANYIIRLNSDGSIDTSFVYGTGFGNNINSIAIQSNGKILVGGNFTSYNGTSANKIIRLNTDGSVDTSFVYGTGFDNAVYSIAIQSDGKILVGGDFSSYNGTSANYIIRLNSDGSIDTSFVYSTGFNADSYIFSIAIQSNGSILVGGSFTSYNGTGANYIVSLNSVTNVTDFLKGYFWVCSTAGDFLGESVQVGDTLIAKVDYPTATLSDWLILQGNVVVATETVDGIVRLGTQQEVLDGTESGAVVVTPATLQGKFDSNSFATTLLVANWVADTDFYYQDVTHNLDSNWFNISAFDLSNNMLCQLQVNYTDANSLRAYVNEIPTDSIVIALSRVNPTM